MYVYGLEKYDLQKKTAPCMASMHVMHIAEGVHLVSVPELQCLVLDVVSAGEHQQLHQCPAVCRIVGRTVDGGLPFLVATRQR